MLDYCSLVDEIADRMRPLPIIRFRGYRSAATNGTYGRYFGINEEFVAFLRYDAAKWATLAETPLWLDVMGSNWKVDSPEVKSRLEILSHEQPPRLMVTANQGSTVPLFLPIGQERQQVVDSLTKQVLGVLALLVPDSVNP